MRVGWYVPPLGGLGLRHWGVLALAVALIAGCSSRRDERAEAADADGRAASSQESDDVLAAFNAWANDSTGSQTAAGGNSAPASPAPDAGSLDNVLERFNRKVSTCWKQPFGMPRLATVRLLVQFNPNGTVRSVTPSPEAAEAPRYRTEAPYLVMIAQTSQALRQCQPYDGIRQNYAELSQLEMVVDPRMFQN